jgi:drug/metabolite transporter (DMT)-like permease
MKWLIQNNGLTMHTEQQTNIRVVLAFAAIYLIWGSTFYGVSIALKSFPVFMLSSLRLLIAGLALLVVCIFRKESFPSYKDILRNGFCGLFIFLGGILAVVWAQQYISSSLASIIITTPFWFIVLDRRQWNFYFSSKWIIGGLLTGLAGVVLLLKFRNTVQSSVSDDMQVISIVTIIAGSAMWVAGSLYLKYYPTPTSTYVSTSIQLLSAGIFCLAISAFRNELQNIGLTDIGMDSWIALFYLSIFSSLITFMCFIWLIKIRPPAIVSTYAYVNPVVAVLLGWGFGNEHISMIQLVALMIILTGLFLVNVPKYKGALSTRSNN